MATIQMATTSKNRITPTSTSNPDALIAVRETGPQ